MVELGLEEGTSTPLQELYYVCVTFSSSFDLNLNIDVDSLV